MRRCPKIRSMLHMMISTTQALQTANKEKGALDERVNDLEQYSRKDDFIITRLQIQHESYALAASNTDVSKGGGAPPEELDVLETTVTLGKGKNDGKPVILLRLVNRKIKQFMSKSQELAWYRSVYE